VNLEKIRRLLKKKHIKLEITIHAAVEALKDGLGAKDLEFALFQGNKIEDYGNRALILAFTPQDALPFHVVVEYFEGDPIAFIVTAYVPGSREWESNWKTRKRKKKYRPKKK
jgi:Domain of unknown function (DUF4258)